MTRLAILADIHGNLPALEAIIEDMAQYEVDHVISAGDQINVGPFSAQVVEQIALSGWSAVRGNHEFYYLNHGTPREPEQHRDFTMPPWLRRTIPNRWQSYIAAMADELTLYYPDATPVTVTHGIPGDPWKGIHMLTPQAEAAGYLKGVRTDTVIVGHTHLPFLRTFEVEGRQVQVINPGSAGVPLDGNPGMAHYAIMESHEAGWEVSFKRVKFDLQRVFDEYERIDYVGEVGHTGFLLAEELRTARLRIIPYMMWRRETCPDTPNSLELAKEYLKTGRFWEYVPEPFWVNLPEGMKYEDRHRMIGAVERAETANMGPVNAETVNAETVNVETVNVETVNVEAVNKA